MVQVENEEEKKTAPDGPVISSPKHRPSFVGRRQGPLLGQAALKTKLVAKDKNGKSPWQPSWKQSKFTQEAADALDMTNDMDATEEEKRYQERVRRCGRKWKEAKEMTWVEGYDDDDDDEDGQAPRVASLVVLWTW